MGSVKWKTFFWKIFSFISILLLSVCDGITDPRDVVAINNLYISLGFPELDKWVPYGGDPCGENWHGVQCVNSNITEIFLGDSNLGGELGDHLGDFTSIIQIDLRNNNIGGVIPSNLPSTIMTFLLSDNQFTGSIPETISSLGQVTDLSFDNNYLNGDIPDAFQQLPRLINLNLSGNSLSGQLPSSMATLSYLTTLHLQNNQLTGTLDVLQDLPLIDLNVENNLFSGPVPSKLLTIPNFRGEGNPFNNSTLPSTFYSPPPSLAPRSQASSTGIQDPTDGNKSLSSKKPILIVISGALVLIFLGLGLCLFLHRRSKRKQLSSKIGKNYESSLYDNPIEKTKTSASLPKLYSPRETEHKEPSLRPLIMHGKGHQRSISFLNPNTEDGGYDSTFSIKKSIDINEISTISLSKKIPSSVSSFTIASLQQYTDSFSQENLIGRGSIGSVYKAQTHTGRVLSVKKLDIGACKSNEDFLELVCNVSKLQHPNIVTLVGYCAEHGQELLIYEYCKNGSLYEALHFDDQIHKKLSWNNRIRLVLGAARALEYMHEACQPPMVHKNFKSVNILLDDELVVHVSDSGLAPLLSSVSLTRLSSSGYGAPELELGTYTSQSDVYSFGVVMLEILTGRKSYDRSRPRGEQFLVRWAVQQLHDIDSLVKMVDPSLEGTYPTKSLSRFADIISLCLQPEPEFRPPMSEIVQNLLHMI